MGNVDIGGFRMNDIVGIPFRPFSGSEHDVKHLTSTEKGLLTLAMDVYKRLYLEASLNEPMLVLCDGGNEWGLMSGDHYAVGFGLKGEDYLRMFGEIPESRTKPVVAGNNAIALRILIKLRLIFFYHDCHKDAVFITDFGRHNDNDDSFYQRMEELLAYELPKDADIKPKYETGYSLNMINHLSAPVAVIGFCPKGKYLRDRALSGDPKYAL